MAKKVLSTLCSLTFVSAFAFALTVRAEMGGDSYQIPPSVISGGGVFIDSD